MNHISTPRVTRSPAHSSDRPPVCSAGTYMQRQLYTVYTRAWAGREICANVVYNVPAPMYYIRAKEWCNKEAVSRSLPSIPEVTTSCKSHACLCTMETHTRMLVSCYKCTAPYAILPSCAKNYIYKNDRAYFDSFFIISIKYSFFKFIFIFLSWNIHKVYDLIIRLIMIKASIFHLIVFVYMIFII